MSSSLSLYLPKSGCPFHEGEEKSREANRNQKVRDISELFPEVSQLLTSDAKLSPKIVKLITEFSGEAHCTYQLLSQAFNEVFGPYQAKSEADVGHNFVPELLTLTAEYYCDEITPPNPIGRHWISCIGIGKKIWEDLFGNVGEVPALPKDILNILTSPCPFNPDKTIFQTHTLVLVPETLDGTPLTLKRLNEITLAKNKLYWSGQIGDLQDKPFEKSHWILMTRTVLLETRNKNYEEQQRIAARYPGYSIPMLSEATVAIFMEYLVRRVELCTTTSKWSLLPTPCPVSSKLTNTRCLETNPNGFQNTIGSFHNRFARVLGHPWQEHDSIGISLLRRFN